MSNKNSDYYFLRGGGEMGELIRAKDWSKTSLGDPADWPQSLCTMVAVMLDNPFGMYIAWGSEYIGLYNDGYRPILGATKHPQALGISTKETFSEIWYIIESMFDGVMKGNAVGYPDLMLPLNRNGFVEECYFDFSYSPIRKNDGEVGGVLVTVIETTEKKRATAALKESNERYISNMMQAPVAMCIFRGKNHVVEMANEQMLNLWGKQANQVMNKPIFEGLPEAKDQGLEELVDTVFNTGEKFVANERPVNLPRNGKVETAYINFIYDALKEADGTISGIVATAIEVTPQVKARSKVEESDKRFRNTMKQAPVGITILRGPQYIVEMANNAYLQLVDRKEAEFVGNPLFASLPEVEEAVHSLLDNVLNTGVPYHGNEVPVPINRHGKEDVFYFDFLYYPLREEDDTISGVIVAVTEVTEKVETRKKIEESKEAIQESKVQMEFILESAKGGYWDLDLLTGKSITSFRHDQCFGATEPITNWSYEKFLTYVYPEDRESEERKFKEAVAKGSDWSIDCRVIWKDGSIHWIQSSGRNYRYVDGKPTRMLGMVREITEQKEAQMKIEENEQRLNIVVEASELGTWELNLKTKEPTYSKRYLEILGGYTEDIKLTHAQLLQHLHPDDFPIREKAFKKAMDTGYLHYEARLIWKDESIHWMEGKGKVFYDEENQPVKLIGTIRDITEEKNHEQELKESEYKFRLLADSMPQHIWTSDPEGNLNYYNQSVFDYSGLTLEQINKDGWIQIVHPDDREENIKQWVNSITTGKDFLFEHRFRKHDGEYRWQLSRAIPQKDENGKIQMWVGASTDINEQKKAQEQFKVLADQAPMWVWLTDKEVNILYTNPEVLKFLGIAHYTEFTGNMWEQKVHPEDIAMVYKTFGEAALLQQSFSFEFRVQNAKTRQYEWFYIKAVPRLEDAEFTGFIGTGININEQKTFAKELEEQVITRTAELKASEEKFYNLFNLSPISKTLSDTSSGKIVMVNDAFTKLFGYSREETLNKSSAELGLLDLEAREIIINELKTNGKIENREIWFIKKSGEKFIALASAEVISMGDKQFFLSAFNDISEIKIAEQNIKQKNIELENKTIQLEEAQQLAHIGSWEWDVVANKIEWSDELFRIFGLTPQEFKADYENYLKYIHPDDRDYVNSIVQEALKDHQPYSFFHKVACADGKVRILSATGKVFTDGVGNVIRMSGTAQDVTEQKKYEEELKISEERFYKIFDNNPVPMYISEIKTNKIKYANNRFYNAFGFTEKDVTGRSSQELNLLDPEETKRVANLLLGYLLENRPLAEVQALSKEEREALLLKLQQSEKMRDFEILYTRKNGEKFPALVSFEVIRIGVDSYTVTSCQDITERKKVEAQLRSQNDQLEKMNKELESFAYISSHDLQEPLRKIQTFASRIKEKEENNLSDSGKDMFNRMQDSANRMQTLIQDLLAYSRTNTTEPRFETTDLNEIIAEVKEDLKEELKEKLATIEANQLCDADIIPFQFRQLMHNLIGNSLKFSNPENPPHIKIKSEIANGIKFNNEKLSPQNKYCHITVSDNGIGFEQQYSEKIFEVFQRLHGKNEFNGSGIGLSIVKKIVENHNGIITAHGELNKGATFEIYIPAT